MTDWVQDYELADASFRYFDVYFLVALPKRSPTCTVIDLRSRLSRTSAPLFISAGRNDSRCPFPPIEEFVEKAGLGKEIERRPGCRGSRGRQKADGHSRPSSSRYASCVSVQWRTIVTLSLSGR